MDRTSYAILNLTQGETYFYLTSKIRLTQIRAEVSNLCVTKLKWKFKIFPVLLAEKEVASENAYNFVHTNIISVSRF